MATPFSCKGEAYSSGGPGIFLLGRAEALSQTLAAEYEGSVTLIYLDPPFGTGDTFSVKLSSQKARLTIPAYADTLSREDWDTDRHNYTPYFRDFQAFFYFCLNFYCLVPHESLSPPHAG